VSVPRREGMPRSTESEAQQPRDVPVETAISRFVAHMREEHPRSDLELSTRVRSAVRTPSSERCVSCVPSAVALRKRELRTSELRKCEWRTGVPSSVFAYPPASPKDTLAGVFERLKRAARTKLSSRISKRLAPQSQRPEFQRSELQVQRQVQRMRESVGVRMNLPCDA
jgi:hypothetical protein